MAVPSTPNIYPKPCAQLDYIAVFWQPPLSDGGSPITSYTITCSPINFSRTVPSNHNQLELRGLSIGIVYTFSISAANINGSGPFISFRPIQVGGDPSEPSHIIASTINNTSVLVTWNFSTLTTGQAPTHYFVLTVIPSTIGIAPIMKGWTFENQNNFIFDNLSTGITYHILTQAVNDIRYSSYNDFSNYFTVQTTWLPTMLDPIQCWFDASLLSYYNGQALTSWVDQAKQSILNLAAGKSWPTLRTAALNGLSVTTFNTSNVLKMTPLLSETTQSFFAVVRQSGGINKSVFGSYTSNQYIGYAGGKKKIINLDGNPNTVSVTNSDSNWDIISLTLVQNVSNNMYWNGTSIEVSNNSNIINSLSFNNEANPSNCEIAEVIFYNRDVITEERQVVEGYLAWKWGLQLNLPPNHPWSATPPPIDYTTKRPPRAFTSVYETNGSNIGFTINWTGGQSIYGPTTYTYTLKDQPVIPISTTSTSATFTGLRIATIYSVIITASNKFGSTLSSPFDAYTSPTVPIITNVSNVSSNQITVNWTGGLAATFYTYTFNGVLKTAFIDNGLTGKNATFTNLTPGIPYTIIVTAINIGGSASSSTYVTQTAPAAPIVTATLVGPDTITVAWPPAAGAISYTYQISPSVGITGNLIGTTAIFSNLADVTLYVITITAINSYGQTTSVPLSVSTIPRAFIPNIDTNNVRGTSFDVTWTTAPNYVYSYILVPGSGGRPSSIVNGVFSPLTVSSLTPNTSYDINMWETYTPLNLNIYASTITVITTPNEASSLSVSSITTNSFTLKWLGAEQTSTFSFSLNNGTTRVNAGWLPNPYNTSQSGIAFFSSLTTGATYNGIIVYGSNRGGTIQSNSYPSVTLLPGAITNPVPSLFSQSSFTLNWSTPIGATSLVYGSLQPTTTNGVTGPSVYTSLSSGTYYSTIITPYNLSGTQAGQSTLIVVKTQTDKPTNIQQSRVYTTFSSLYITWSGVTGAEYYKYMLGTNLGATPIIGQSSITITGLTANTNYSTAIIAYATAWVPGTIIVSTMSDYITFITAPDIPTNITVNSTTISSVQITWSTVASTTYEYLLGSTIYSSITIPLNVSSLTANSTYTITIIGTNPGGSTTSTITFTTAPVPPSNLSTSNITNSQFLLYWSGTQGASSLAFHYGTSTIVYAAPVASPVAITNLSTATIYNDVYIEALSPNYPTSVSEHITVSTLSIMPPTPITNISTSNISFSSFALYWSGAANASSLILHYGNIAVVSSATVTSPVTVTGLTQNSTYNVYIEAINILSTISSNNINVTTAPNLPNPLIVSSQTTSSSFQVVWSTFAGITYSYTVNTGASGSNVTPPLTINSGLVANSTYTFTLRATNTALQSSASSIQAYTLPGAPNPSTLSIDVSSFQITWTQLSGITYSYRFNNGSTFGISSPPLLISSGITGNTTYPFILIAQNIVGTAQSTISVLTVPVAQIPSVVPNSVYGSQFSITFNTPSGISYYSYTLSNGASGSPFNPGSAVTGLSTNTLYTFTLISNNASGSSQAQVNVTTGPNKPTGIGSRNIQLTQFDIFWNGNADATSYTVNYNGYTQTTSLTAITINQNVLPNTNYNVYVIARNANGLSDNSNTISVSTPQPKPINLQFYWISPTGFTVSWNAADGAVSYIFKLNGITTTSTDPMNTSIIPYKYASFGSLTWGTTYSVIVIAVDSSGNQTQSDTGNVSTFQPKPINLQYSNLTATSFTVNWSDAYGATSYKYKLNDVLTIPSTDNGVASKTASFSNLIGGTAYTVIVIAVDSAGTNVPSDGITIRTLIVKPFNLFPWYTWPSSFTVHWEGGTGATFYTYTLNGTTTIPEIDDGISSNLATFTGLSLGTVYNLIVTASNSYDFKSSDSTAISTEVGQPTNLVFSGINGRTFTVSWSDAYGATSYIYTLNGNQTSPSSENINSKTATFTGLSYNTTYIVNVRAVLLFTSKLSDSSSVKTLIQPVTTVAGKVGVQATQDGTGTNASFHTPLALCVNPKNGDIYVSDTGSYTIRKVTPEGVVTTVAGQVGVLGSANGIGTQATFNIPNGCVIVDDFLYICETYPYSPNLRRMNINTLEVTTYFEGIRGSKIATNGNGNFYISNYYGNLQKLNSSGNFNSNFNTTLLGVTGIAVDSNENVYAATISQYAPQNALFKIDSAGNVQTILPEGTLNDAFGMCISSDNSTLYIADTNNQVIRKLQNGQLTVLTGTLRTPTSLNAGSQDGTLAQARFYSPYDVKISPDGQCLYVADSGNQVIRRIQLIGAATD